MPQEGWLSRLGILEGPVYLGPLACLLPAPVSPFVVHSCLHAFSPLVFYFCLPWINCPECVGGRAGMASISYTLESKLKYTLELEIRH